MPIRRRAEIIVGILVGVSGIAGLLVGTSLLHECTAVTATGQDTCSTVFAPGALIASSGSGSLVILVIIAMAIVGITVGTVMYSVSGNNGWRVLIWCLTIVLLAGTVLTVASIGLLLVPAVLLALIASVLAGGAPPR